jgi:phospholipid/cholesterol/gamma-HCH transport system permease protein
MPDAALGLARRPDGALVLQLQGAWHLTAGIPSPAPLDQELDAVPPPRVAFDASRLAGWDSGLLTFLVDVSERCRKRGVAVEEAGLPAGVQRLMALAEAVPERAGARREAVAPSLLARVGAASLGVRDAAVDSLDFLGRATEAIGRFAAARARYRGSDFWLLVQEAGAGALGIVTLVSFLVGAILAFVGAVQLEQFGAQIYVADLVGIGMVRDMGAMMAAIVMAGRTGATYAAQLGSMKVNQEIDALATLGLSPIEFLVMPRMLALALMMPLLGLYADFVGILGGAAVGIGMLKLPVLVYYHETAKAVQLGSLAGGVIKAGVYGVLIAIAGCSNGLRCGNSSSAVGEATTKAVVAGIVSIITACGLFAVAFYVLGF